MRELLNQGCETNFEGYRTEVYTETEKAHGGIEQRDVRVIEIPKDLPHSSCWMGLITLADVVKRLVRDGLESFETRFMPAVFHRKPS